MEGTNKLIFNRIGQYLQDQKIIQESDLDVEFFTFNIITFSYFIVLDKYRAKSSVNRQKLVQKFINHYTECIPFEKG
jgi:hypothetical protein